MNEKDNRQNKVIKELIKNNYRIFEIEEAYDLLSEEYTPTQLNRFFHILKGKKWIRSIKRGVYCLEDYLLSTPLHEYEIVAYLIKDPIISYFSAFSYHKLTDQIPRAIYVSVPTTMDLPRIKMREGALDIKYVKKKAEKLFGFEEEWFGETRVKMTDLERTLLDGLSKPRYCGGFAEVYSAFVHSQETLNLDKIVGYALNLDTKVVKRLGWVLEKIGVGEKVLSSLEHEKISWIVDLNADGKRLGSINKRWQIRENADFH